MREREGGGRGRERGKEKERERDVYNPPTSHHHIFYRKKTFQSSRVPERANK